MKTERHSYFTHLECTKTGQQFDLGTPQNLSPVGAPLFARYDMEAARAHFSRNAIRVRENSLWRYAPMLPVLQDKFRLNLGEGWTPLIKPERWNRHHGFKNLFLKDESGNPTLSFKARGLALAISRAHELGIKKIALPSAGNAAGATAAYCASAGIECHVFMPEDVPELHRLECAALGATVHLVKGLITDCGKEVARRKEEEGWFDVSTLKEPYRVEGKKTMGYELAEHFDWTLPDVIVYPTGGGTGLIGMWKAFDEMEQLGWIDSRRPRMVSVQSTGCAPIVHAFQKGLKEAPLWEDAETIAAGLRVPAAVGDFLMLRALYESNGTAVEVEDQELLDEMKSLGAMTGIVAAPEGAAAMVAVKKLRERRWIAPEEKIVVFNTGAGLKYKEAVELCCR